MDLEPTNVWYHQRLVRWLLFRGRSRDARCAWARALDQTQGQHAWGEPDLWYSKNLHWLVACRAIDTGELQLARAILNQIPRSLLAEDPDLRRADRLLDAFERSERGVLTYPLDEEVRDGLPRLWSQPRRLPDRSDVDGQERISWYAARVEALESDRLHLLVGVPTPEASSPVECSWAEMPRSIFGQAVVDEEPGRVTVGRFFEAGEYGADRRLVIRLFPLLDAAVPETVLR